VEDTKRIRFSNMAKFMFNEDQAIIFNRLNGQWIKVPKQCYDILELCNKEGLSWSALSESLADDEDREYMKQLIKLLDSMNCLYNDDEKIIENISFAITHRCNLKCIHCMVNAAFGQSDKEHFDTKTICAFLDKIVAANPKNITLTGGEPLLRSDFLTILGYLRSIYNGKITLMTNGTLITPKNVKEIVSQIDSIDISLDGADEDLITVALLIIFVIVENIIFRIIQQFQGEVSAEPISIINAIAIVIGGCLFVSAISMTISTIFSNVYIGYGFSGIFWLYWNINCQTESIINPFPFIANPTFYEKHLVLIYIITVGLILVNCFLCTRSPFYFGDKIRKCFYR